MLAWVMVVQLRLIWFTTLRWTAAWAAIGLLLGGAMVLGRVPPIAEPGAPSGFGFYLFWLPVCLGAASVLGLLLGLIYACLMAAVELWEGPGGTKKGFMSTYGRRLLCGAFAGGLIGFPAMHDVSTMWVVGLGVASAAVSGFMNRPKSRSLDVERDGRP